MEKSQGTLIIEEYEKNRSERLMKKTQVEIFRMSDVTEMQHAINAYLNCEYDLCEKSARCFELVDIKMTEFDCVITATIIYTIRN